MGVAGVTPLGRLVERLCQQAQRYNQRRLLVLCGERPWCRDQSRHLLALLGDTLWVGDDAPSGCAQITNKQAPGLLGGEQDTVFYDAWSGFDPNAFGALSGTLRGGALMVLLTPPLAHWSAFHDPEQRRIAVAPYTPEQISGRYQQRLACLLREPGAHWVVVEQGGAVPEPDSAPQPPPRPPAVPPCRSHDQAQAVQALLHVVDGHRRRPLVLTSDRGRGKSSALGIAAARLLQRGAARVLVTAPRTQAVGAVFEQAQRLLPDARRQGAALRHGEASLEFVAPDALVSALPEATIVLVDEAAAIPAFILERLLVRYPRIAFATTVHGYEGTGRGFAIRFQQVLHAHTPHWQGLHLDTPIRWNGADPLEAAVERLLLLDAEPADSSVVDKNTVSAATIELLDRSTLATDETTLRQLFGLLVSAHYQTSPLDLRHLLDGPNLQVYVLRHSGQVLATALLATEGGFDEHTAQAVWAGRRRPQGHLMAQSLATHHGLEYAPLRLGARVMRIAVHPELRRTGLGSQLLERLATDAAGRGLDYLGASFAAEPGLLGFWDNGGLRPVRIGLNRETNSGSHTLMVMRPLSVAGDALYRQARQQFLRQLPVQLADPLQALEPELAVTLLRRFPGETPPELPQQQDWMDLLAFACAARVYEATPAGVQVLLQHAIADPQAVDLLSPSQWALALARVLQHRPWPQLLDPFALAGRRQGIEQLRQLLRPLLLHYGAPWVRDRAQTLLSTTRTNCAEPN